MTPEEAEEAERSDAEIDPDAGYAYVTFDAEADDNAEDEQPLPLEEDEAELGEEGLENEDPEAAQDSYGDADDEPPEDENLQDEVPEDDGFQETAGFPEKSFEDTDLSSEKGKGKRRRKKKKTMLWQQDDGKYVVQMRQKLKNPEVVSEFCNELQAKVDELKAAGDMLTFEDFDISENRVAEDGFESILGILADGVVHVERFRAFGCPTLNDEAASFLANWLLGVTRETTPFELHLSDCAITSDGFHDLMRALQDNDAFPGPDPKKNTSQLPIYLRLEHNYIENSAIQQAIDDNIMVAMKKGDGVYHSTELKARLLVREDGRFQQKTGMPPAPEDVPPPRPVRPKGKGKGKGKSVDGGKGQGKGKGKRKRSASRRDDRSRDGRARGRDRDRDWQRESTGIYRDRNWSRDRDWKDGRDDRHHRERKGSSRGATPPWAALPAPERSSTHKGKRRGREVDSPRPVRRDERNRSGNDRWKSGSKKGDAGNAPYNAFSRGRDGASGKSYDGGRKEQQRGEASHGCGSRPGRFKRSSDLEREEDSKRHRPSSAYDSRPSRPKQSGADAGRGQRPRDGDLPPNWETHWSDEYHIWYYWNNKTGASSWENPNK
mmetsp:Transcript_133406/g.259737  ORF Transcript_133406/g.259737 Transcript_133406/m.259737 type:complete len:605 (-) Transcript_133406:135-1949(-)